MRSVALVLALLPLSAAADCGAGRPVFSCQIGQKALEICHLEEDFSYSFGPASGPELTITEPLASLDYAPYSGFGRSRFYAVTFRNDGFAYEVWSSFDRIGGDNPPLEGGVTVRNGSATVAELTCNPGGVAGDLESIAGLKTGIGQCFDWKTGAWRDGACGTNPEVCSCQTTPPTP